MSVDPNPYRPPESESESESSERSKHAGFSFRYPGGDVAVCTILVMLVGGFILYSGIILFSGIPQMRWNFFAQMRWNFFVYAAMTIPAVGMWFQFRPAGYMFGVLAVALSVHGLHEMLFNMDFSSLSFSRIIGPSYFALTAFKWARQFQKMHVA